MKAQCKIERLSNAWQMHEWNNSLTFQRSQNFYMFNLSGWDINDPVVVEVHHWFVAGGTFKEELKCLFERESLAAWPLAAVKTRGFSRIQAGFPVFQEHGTFGLG